MNEKRREEVYDIVMRFKGKPVTVNAMKEFCDRNKISEVVSLGELQDHIAQVEHDAKLALMVPEILAELQKFIITPEFALVSDREAIMKTNNEIRINIAKLFERYEIDYGQVDTLGQNVGSMIGSFVSEAGTTIFNKGLEVLMHLAKEKFGGNFNAKHASDYAEDVIKKQLEKNEKKAEAVDQAMAKPEVAGEKKDA